MNYLNRKCIVRCNDAGVFYGTVIEKTDSIAGVEVTIQNCQRIYYWEGAATLNQLATEGVKVPENCKFTVVVPEMSVMEVIEIIPASEAAIQSIESVVIWKA